MTPPDLPEIALDDVKDTIDIVTITVIDEELEAVLRFFSPTHVAIGHDEEANAPRLYYIAEIVDSQKHPWKIAILQVKNQGNNTALALTAKALQTIKPKWILLVGIAGGAPGENFTLGDVYLTTRIHDLSVSARLQGTDPQDNSYRPGGGPLSMYVESLANSIAGYTRRLGLWNSEATLGCSRPPLNVTDSSAYYGSKSHKSRTRESLQRHFTGSHARTKPGVVSGATFSSNTLLKNDRLLEQWQRFAKDSHTVEMELAGIFDAVRHFGNGTDLLAVKGVSDLVGFKRSEEWTEYACRTSASFAYSLIKAGLLHQQITPLPDNNGVDDDQTVESPVSFQWSSPLPRHIDALQYLPSNTFDECIRALSRLISHFATPSPQLLARLPEKSTDTLLHDLWDILSSGTVSDFPVFGSVGSGKTALLSALALVGRRASTETTNVAVDYLNLHEFDDIQGDSLESTHDTIKRKFDEVIQKLRTDNGSAVVYLFVDGYEVYPRGRVPTVLPEFYRAFSELSGVKVFGIGIQEEHERRLARHEKRGQQAPVKRDGFYIELSSVPISRSKDVCDSYCDFHNTVSTHHPMWRYSTGTPTSLRRRMNDLCLRRVDLFRLHMLCTSDSQEFVKFAAVIDAYLRREIGNCKLGNDAIDVERELQITSQYLFDRWVRGVENSPLLFQVRNWSLTTASPFLRHWFHARHIILTLHSIGNALLASEITPDEAVNRWRKAGLSGVLFPADTNSHCKWFLNDRRQESVLAAIKAICNWHPAGDTPLDVTHLCYLLGRIEGFSEESNRFLDSLRDRYFGTSDVRESRSEQPDEDSAKRDMLQCTILISEMLVCGEKRRMTLCEEFLALMRNHDWRKVASVFHLQYYGDGVFRHDFISHLRDHDTALDPYPRTLDEVESRLIEPLRRRKKLVAPHKLFDVEMAMVFALANDRQASEDVEWSSEQVDCRDRVRRIADLCFRTSSERVRRRPVWPYARLTSRFLVSNEATHPFVFASKLYETKTETPRAGWMEKLSLKGRIESVAAHTWSSMLLAELLLPEMRPVEIRDERYSKSEIIRMLLIHDLAEAFTGDRPSDMEGQNPGGEHRSEESNLIEMLGCIGMLGFEGFGDLHHRWSECEERRTVNGRIANCFDKADALIQLVFYSKWYWGQRSHRDTRCTWDSFYVRLHEEVVQAIKGDSFLERIMEIVLDWADDEYHSGHSFLKHETLFAGMLKYYPRQGRRGSPVRLESGKHFNAWHPDGD